jgi:hypothetical protein
MGGAGGGGEGSVGGEQRGALPRGAGDRNRSRGAGGLCEVGGEQGSVGVGGEGEKKKRVSRVGPRPVSWYGV